MTYVALYMLVTPALVLVGTGPAISLGSTPDAMGNPGGHGFAEVLYPDTSGANNNGSATRSSSSPSRAWATGSRPLGAVSPTGAGCSRCASGR